MARYVFATLAAAVVTVTPLAASAGDRESAAFLLLAAQLLAKDQAQDASAGAEKSQPATPDSGTSASNGNPDSGTASSNGRKSTVQIAAVGAAAPDAVRRFNGKPYKLYPDGKVNFATYRGYNLYASVCHVCHGHAALGSSFAPSLVDSLKSMSYEDFVTVVMNGRQNITSATTNVMPSFGDNPTVAKYIDSLYAYLKARSDGAIGDGDIQWEGPKDQ